jgi:haloalkane dehalogenase
METLRTPDDRFENLPRYPYRPNYVEVPDGEGGALRVHYVDEGPADAEVVLCMHGEPSWSFLYRNMIPIFRHAGYRVVAPDLVGFGRSDKPVRREDYTYQRHVDWMEAWLVKLDLTHMTLVCQDWGGLIGIRLATGSPDRFDRIVAANTGLPTGDVQIGEGFLAWRKASQEMPAMPIAGIVQGGCARGLAPEIAAAYDAPFPDESYKAGARMLPALVPIAPDDPASHANRRAWEVLRSWHKPFLTAFSDSDPITGGGDAVFQQAVPGARGQPHTTIRNAGHFLQEDAGEELAREIVGFMSGS